MPDDWDQTFDQAFTQYQQHDPAAALAACERILAAQPDHADALYLAGLCQSRTGGAGLGSGRIERAMALKPELEDYDILRDRLIQQGNGDPAQTWEARFSLYRLFQIVDAFLISYPKCGRTWLRALLGKYVLGRVGRGDPLEILQLTASNPSFRTLEVSHDDYPHWKPAGRIFVNKRAYRGKRVIFLARDPRDTLVSYYFQYTRRGDRELANDGGFDGSLSDFIRHDIGGLPSLVAFYNVWARNREVPAGFLLVTYEDMQKDVRKVLRDVAAFLRWPDRDEAFIDQVVAFGSFENMRELEESNALDNVRLQAPDSGDPESFKVRRGKVGGFTDYLTDEDVDYIDAYLRDNLDEYFAVYK